MPIKSISTQQAGQVLDASHFLSLGTGPVLIFDIEGEVNSMTGTSYFIQLLATGTPTSGTTVPLYSRLCVPSAASSGLNGFSFVYRPIGLDTSAMNFPAPTTADGSNTSSVWVAISLTDNVYTAVAASTQVTVDLEETYLEVPNTLATPTTVGTDSLQVFTSPGASHRLVQFVVTNNGVTGVTWIDKTTSGGMIMLFAYNAANGAVPLQEWFVANGASLALRFDTGLLMMQNDGALNVSGITPTGINRTGCYLFGSTTAQVLTTSVGGYWTMKAYYI